MCVCVCVWDTKTKKLPGHTTEEKGSDKFKDIN